MNIGIDLAVIEAWLAEVVHEWAPDGKWKVWHASMKNRSIKEKFAEEGKRLGLRSHHSGRKNKEFLYDLCWVRRAARDGEDKERRLAEVVLAMELEFSDTQLRHGVHGGIRFDFNKLLQSDAKYKVLCFQMPHLSSVKEAIEKLKEDAACYQSKSASDIFICGWAWKDGGRKFHCESISLSPK